MAEVDAVQGVLESIAPDGIVVGARAVGLDDPADLIGAESALVTRAVQGRRLEFATGRTLLRRLAAEDWPIARADDGRPVLRSGRACTLAHDRSVAIAAVAVRPVVSLGIDIEPDAELAPAEVAVIVHPDDEELEPTVIFALKEAAYKAWSGAGGRLLEHHDIRVGAAGDRFFATVLDECEFSGRWARVADRTIALVVNPRFLVPVGSPVNRCATSPEAR